MLSSLHPKPVNFLDCYVITHVSAGWSHSGFVSGPLCCYDRTIWLISILDIWVKVTIEFSLIPFHDTFNVSPASGESFTLKVSIFYLILAWFPFPDTGSLFTCGDGSFGQLGHGDYESHCVPVQVSYFINGHVEQIACGMRHSLVLLKGKCV